jgi:hypothetical protein
MPDDNLNLGEVLSTHRPSTVRLWIMAIIALSLLMAVALGALLTLDSFVSQPKGGSFERATSPLLCLGASFLCLALFGSFLISDFRKWSASRSVRLRIYQAGLSYESKGQIVACRWDEIKDIDFRVIEIRSKHSTPRKARVIRSVEKSDGTVVTLAATLNLIEITKLITGAKKLYTEPPAVASGQRRS